MAHHRIPRPDDSIRSAEFGARQTKVVADAWKNGTSVQQIRSIAEPCLFGDALVEIVVNTGKLLASFDLQIIFYRANSLTASNQVNQAPLRDLFGTLAERFAQIPTFVANDRLGILLPVIAELISCPEAGDGCRKQLFQCLTRWDLSCASKAKLQLLRRTVGQERSFDSSDTERWRAFAEARLNCVLL